MSPRPDNFHEVTEGIDVDIDIDRTLTSTSTSRIVMRSVQAIKRGASPRKEKTKEDKGGRSTLTKKQRQRHWLWSPLPFLFFGVMSTIYMYIFLHYSLSSFDESNVPQVSSSVLSVSTSRSELVDSKHKTELSACLIVMDDNHFLIEWLAYHYHAANLRHLIITSDPNSKTTPSKVLDRWRDRITIEEWNETKFLPRNFDEVVKNQSFERKKAELNNHRVRQSSFNLQCLKTFKRQNRGWTLLIDSDEYLLPKEHTNETTTTTTTSVSTLLGALKIPTGFNQIYSPCIPINRRQFSARESSNEKVQSMVAPDFYGNDFQTMRWRKFGFDTTWLTTAWGRECGIVRNVPNKAMIDLSRLKLRDLYDKGHSGNPHRPLNICPENVYTLLSQTPFVLNHYMGTPKQWFYRGGDKRGLGYRRARYEDLNERIGTSETDSIRPWLADFVAAVGSIEASRLLKDVGKLEPLPGDTEVADNNKTESESDKTPATYEIGDVVEVNYAGGGGWEVGEIYSIYSNNYYSVFFEDCSQEIATFEARMRPTNNIPTFSTSNPTAIV